MGLQCRECDASLENYVSAEVKKVLKRLTPVFGDLENIIRLEITIDVHITCPECGYRGKYNIDPSRYMHQLEDYL